MKRVTLACLLLLTAKAGFAQRYKINVTESPEGTHLNKVLGEADDTKKRAATIVKLLGRGEIKVIEGADHMTTLSNPEFAKTIEEFFRANKQK